MYARSYWLIRWAEHVVNGAYLGFLAGSVLPNLIGVMLCVLVLIRFSDVKTLSKGNDKILSTTGIVIYLLTYSCVPAGAVLAVQVNGSLFLLCLLSSAVLWPTINMLLSDWE